MHCTGVDPNISFPTSSELRNLSSSSKQITPVPTFQVAGQAFNSQYVDEKHIKNIRIRYLPDDPNEPTEVSQLKMRNWLRMTVVSTIISIRIATKF